MRAGRVQQQGQGQSNEVVYQDSCPNFKEELEGKSKVSAHMSEVETRF